MNTEIISIHTDYIQLDQLLKYANILTTGGQIKELLAEERKKIYPNDVVSIEDEISITVVKEA